MIKVIYTVAPALKHVLRKLRGRRDKVTDLRVAHKKASIFLDRWNKQNFRTEGGLVGGWKPLKLGGRFISLRGARTFEPSVAPGTPNRAFLSGAKILRDSGDLQKSVNPFYSKRDAGIRTRLSYAKYHEHGLGNIPQRRIMPKRKEVIKDIRRLMRVHVREALR